MHMPVAAQTPSPFLLPFLRLWLAALRQNNPLRVNDMTEGCRNKSEICDTC